MNLSLSQLKEKWITFSEDHSLTEAKNEYDNFIQWCDEKKFKIGNKWDFSNMKLDEYTSLTKPDNPTLYFTNWLERKTESCGKFRTASSYAYGIYRVKSNNLDNSPQYKCTELKNNKQSTSCDRDKPINFFENEIRPKLTKIANFSAEQNQIDIDLLDINFCRKIAYMCNPDKLIPIFKNQVIKVIADFFEIEVTINSIAATKAILEKIKIEKWFEGDSSFDITQKLGAFLFKSFGRPLIIQDNTIYYGPPGTGKTYMVTENIRQLVENQEQYELVQFHPGYSYEDFVEGWKPCIIDGQVSLKIQSGKFKEFCKRASSALRQDRENRVEPKKYYFIIDEINRAELSRVFGDILVCIERSKRFDFDEYGNLTSTSFKIQSTLGYADSEENAVIWSGELKKVYFGVPINVFIIGTMNDTDKSIDSFDIALRRRFIWVRTSCDYEVIKYSLLNNNTSVDCVNEYIDRCRKLNHLISEVWSLGSSYELGHAYFMWFDSENGRFGKSFQENIFDRRLAPLIKEYLRSDFSEKETSNKIKEARDTYLGESKKKSEKDNK